MIELLVTMIVLAIGLIGMAGLQAAGLKSNTDALKRTQASLLMSDIIDRIRVNPDANYSIAKTSSPPSAGLTCEASGANCSSTDIVNYDLAMWKCHVGSYDEEGTCQTLGIVGALPKGTASISISADNIYTVEVEWVDSVNRNGEQLVSLSMSTKV